LVAGTLQYQKCADAKAGRELSATRSAIETGPID
jgi:hypothetical protein